MAAKVIHEVQAETLQSWLTADRAVVIDVRELDEFVAEHIPGASLVPLSRFDVRRVPEGNGRVAVLNCRSGKRSRQAAEQLLQAGRSEVWQLGGGLQAWKAAGLPLDGNPRAPLSIMRQVQIAAGTLVLAGTLLGAFVNTWFLGLSGFIGAGLVFAGLSGTCGLATVLGWMPWNRAFATCEKSA